MHYRDLTAEQLAETYRQIFEVDQRGALILEHLIAKFSKGAKVEGGIDAVLATYHRLGEKSVVQHIVNQINRANSVPDNEESE
ncbi:hypothetical protein H4CHR_01569 [Variovorax sp. PBS-H4]|uniref:Bbp19 family protein n=1 Tax=Variovorax sp. PBS-H4 TaxID=434008 RepID=UPI0013175E9C|nr:hypothetical protein [Variovorax sp. PBS-H4]VTU25313.1 hypothetical protein H4CHR_01569 [Variovorax sp. PBS-H4]